MIIRKIPQYSFENLKFLPMTSPDFLNEMFYIELPEIPTVYDKEKVLLSVGNALVLRVIKCSYADEDNLSLKRENCFCFNETDEWILEAELNMQTSDGFAMDKYFVRLPLSAPFATGQIGIYFDGTWVRFMKDGEVINENSGMAHFFRENDEVFIDEILKDAKVSPIQNVTVSYREEKTDATPAFCFPHGWNTNIGDVMTFSHNGTYHLMYLHDRRHHGSRNGFGAHYICQFTTNNLVDWYEEKPITVIDKPWMSYGTGTMVFHNGKYYMSYGLHTERYNGSEEVIVPRFFEDRGEYEILSFEEVFKRGGLPAGASYSESDDGINFTPSDKLIHASRNPSAYADEKITYYCGYGGDGVYEADSFGKPFKRVKSDIDFINDSMMGNTSECPAMFSWNGYKYVLVGFTGYFRTLTEDSDKLVDAAALGEYIYDGLSVPMVAEFCGNRRIIAGWVKSPLGWGGVLMQRELVFETGGKLGMKWIPELVPIPTSDNLICEKSIDKITLKKYNSYYLDLTVNPKKAKRMGVSFCDGGNSCVAELDFENKRVQVNDGDCGEFGDRLETIIEQMKKAPKCKDWKECVDGNVPQNAVNYALSDIQGMDEPFSLRIVLRYSRRMRCTVLDMEIAERRTLISVRDGFFPTSLTFLKDGELDVENAKMYMVSSAE